MMPQQKNQISLDKEKKRFLLNMKLVVAILAIIAVLAIGLSVYFYKKNREITNDPAKVSQKELEDTVKKIDKLIMLPSDEQPTLATVTDKEKLKDQTFFQNSETGDKVLIYVNAKKAYLYRPNTNRLVEVAPLNITQNTDNTSSSSPSSNSSVLGVNSSSTPLVQESITPTQRIKR